MTREMKDSGVEWIGKVPESWNNKKLYNMFKIIGSGTTPKTSHPEFYDNGTIDWLNTGDLNNGYIIETKNKITELALNNVSALKMYPKDSLVVAMYGATIGKVGITKIPVATNQACCILAEPMDTDLKFIFYWLMGNQKEIVALGYGGGQPNISQQLIKKLRIPCPDVLIQQKISTFLDGKTAQIDAIIDNTKQSIAEFKNYKQAIITETVTKGLNPDVKMKDSGIDWIGKIPEHWISTKIKNIVRIANGKDNPIKEGNIPVYGSSSTPFGFTNEIMYNKETVLLGRKGTIDKPHFVTEPFWAVDTTFYTIPKNNANLKFFYYCMTVLDYKKYTYGSAIPSMSQGILNEIKLPHPNLIEQQQIADYLDEKCAHIDSLIADKEKLIGEFETYKKALIYEYVTGKKEVE